MNRLLFVMAFSILMQFSNAQEHVLRIESELNNLSHTRAEVKFDYSKSRLHGKVWLTVKPAVAATDSLRLDAKGMLIHKVMLIDKSKQNPLKYNYADSLNLRIGLGKKFKKDVPYTVYIEYTARPNDLKAKGSAAITDAKGLYFINPDGRDSSKPVQIWTQGETEATSVWIPTIDRPSQKTTQQLSMTVPSEYVSLSNGKLISSVKNADGTRTDTWKMDLPHAPYLFFMGVGDYAIVKDSFKGKEVSYYVEPEFKSVARKIFGNTPEMMAFYSRLLGVDFVWNKYAQITGQDYVSGAMENTTATLHSSAAQQDARELLDENKWEDVVSHELFHHWFGDLVTAENWNNLTVNESFANYGEYLWREYKYGKDAADAHAEEATYAYLNSPGASEKNLVRNNLENNEDMFDVVSYQKGGRILHMLRNYVGDEIFFKTLQYYLIKNKFKTATAQTLKAAFEANCNKPFQWFFDQWYYGSGHPVLKISTSYDSTTRQVMITVAQTQKSKKLFTVPLSIEVVTPSGKKLFDVMNQKLIDTFYVNAEQRPLYVSIDPDRIILAVRNQTKTMKEYYAQYQLSSSYHERKEALAFAAKNIKENGAVELLISGLNDKYFLLRLFAINSLDEIDDPKLQEKILWMAKHDSSNLVKADAVDYLGAQKNVLYKDFFLEKTKDSSYSISGAALSALYFVDPAAAKAIAKEFLVSNPKKKLLTSVINILVNENDESVGAVVVPVFSKMPLSDEKLAFLSPLTQYLSATKNLSLFKEGIDAILSTVEKLPEPYKEQLVFYVRNVLIMNIISRKEAEINAGFDTGGELAKQVEYLKMIKSNP